MALTKDPTSMALDLLGNSPKRSAAKTPALDDAGDDEGDDSPMEQVAHARSILEDALPELPADKRKCVKEVIDYLDSDVLNDEEEEDEDAGNK